jgi:hypothetical protein
MEENPKVEEDDEFADLPALIPPTTFGDSVKVTSDAFRIPMAEFFRKWHAAAFIPPAKAEYSEEQKAGIRAYGKFCEDQCMRMFAEEKARSPHATYAEVEDAATAAYWEFMKSQ